MYSYIRRQVRSRAGRGAQLGLFLLATALSSQARAETDDLVTRALGLQGAGHSDEAYKLLAPAAEARAGDPEFDFALGVTAADSGRYGEAIAALQRVIAVQPTNAQARAEIARVYALAGDIDTAKAEFDTVVDDPTVPDPVRQRLTRLVRDYDQQLRGGAGAVTGFVDGEAGYDSNVNTATSATSITLPVFAFLGPAALTGAATRMDQGYYQLQGGLSSSAALGRQDRVYVSGLASWRDNFSNGAFDQAAVTGTAGISHTLASRDVLSLSTQVQRFWLGHHGYRSSVGAIAQYTGLLSGGRALSGQLQYYRFYYDKDPLRDADRYAATLSYADRTWFAGLGGGRERTVRSGARHLGYWFAAAQAGTEHPLSERLALLAGASVEHRNYDKTEPLFLKGRTDTQLDGTLGIRFALGKGVSVRPRVTYTRNFSNVRLYDYSRVTAAVGVRFEF